jgi:hypothetical protein
MMFLILVDEAMIAVRDVRGKVEAASTVDVDFYAMRPRRN